MNLLRGKDGKIYFENNYYIKKQEIGNVLSNRRISNIFIDYKLHIEKFFKTYCLDEINFQENDLVIDCGANIGELYLAFDEKKIKISYITFEPDKKAFNSLEKNTKNAYQQLYNLALSDKNEKRNLYTDTDGGNTSLSEFESTSEEIETKTLDSFNFKNIKLLKIDAEGHEPDTLD